MTINYRAEAERAASDAVEQGAFHWSMAGKPPGERGQYIDVELKSRLVDALVEIEPLKQRIEDIASVVIDARDNCAHDGADVGEGARKALEALCSERSGAEKFVKLAEEAIDALVDSAVSARAELERLKGEEHPQSVRVVRPAAKTPKGQLGITTMDLPFLSMPANEIREVVPVVVGAKPDCDETATKSKRTRASKQAK